MWSLLHGEWTRGYGRLVREMAVKGGCWGHRRGGTAGAEWVGLEWDVQGEAEHQQLYGALVQFTGRPGDLLSTCGVRFGHLVGKSHRRVTKVLLKGGAGQCALCVMGTHQTFSWGSPDQISTGRGRRWEVDGASGVDLVDPHFRRWGL